MALSTISALSPLDGRYASRPRRCAPDERTGLHGRAQVEACWVHRPVRCRLRGIQGARPQSSGYSPAFLGLAEELPLEADALAIKEIEKTTNHDVKAVEYWIKSKFEARPELKAASEFVHFACTSEDINNTRPCPAAEGAREHVLLPGNWTRCWPGMSGSMPTPQCRC